MVRVEEINRMEQVQQLLFEQRINEDNKRLRSSFFYRGLGRADYKLMTSLSRNCGDLSGTLEPFLLNNFKKYVSIEDPTIEESDWKAMIVGQHHGLPTRLMDWTHSIPIALHFATTENDFSETDKHDCAVWRFDAKEINMMLPDKYKVSLKERKTFIFSIKELNTVVESIEEYDEDMLGNAFITVEPPSIDQRIVNQYSFFTIMPSKITDLEKFFEDHTNNTVKYIISRNLRWDLRDILDQWNINERMIYPGKDGIAKWLARHYYVLQK